MNNKPSNDPAANLGVLPGRLTISKTSDDVVRIAMRDNVSGSVFATAELSPAVFAEALFGLAEVECQLRVSRLDTVGKKKVVEPRTITAPTEDYDREKLRQWLRENAQEPGWEINDYLGRQGAVRHDGAGGTVLSYSVFKYVD